MDTKNLICFNDITKAYKMGNSELKVLKGINFNIKKGEFVAILGPSGSGKSTIMNIMGCIDTPTTGEYLLDGNNVAHKSEDELANIRNKTIGFIFQKFNLLSKYTAVHNVEIPILLRGVSRKEANIKAVKALEMVGLTDRMHHKPMELSGGQRQRVAIARALVGEPDILLADEPTGNLDSKSGEEVMDLIVDLNKRGNTIIIITHDNEIAKKAHRIINIRDGEIS